MPAAIEEIIKRKVIEQWLSGEARDKIASELHIGAGTVSSIVSDFKKNLQGSDIDSARELAIDAKRQGLSLSDLALHFRLYNYFRSSGASEDEIESFITKVHSNQLPPEKVVRYVNQLFDISKEQSIPVHEVPSYIEKKLEEKQKIENEIKEANDTLEDKKVTIEAINEHLNLKEELSKHGISTQDIDKLLKLLVNAGRYGFDGKEIASKLYNLQELEWKEMQLKGKCKKLSKRISKYKNIVPLTEEIAALQIGIDELIALKVGISEAAKHYNLPPLIATLQLINDLKKYNKIGGLKKELTALNFQKYVINEFCSRHSEALNTLAKLQSHGITEDRILYVNSFLENNGYNIGMKSNS
jgi:hypothetical protein